MFPSQGTKSSANVEFAYFISLVITKNKGRSTFFGLY